MLSKGFNTKNTLELKFTLQVIDSYQHDSLKTVDLRGRGYFVYELVSQASATLFFRIENRTE